MTEEKSPRLALIKQDRILNTYRVIKSKSICYDASGFFSPIAIRDQVIRVCLILERAKELEIISSERPLLIVGGGVAGITAAIKAVELKIPAVLVEQRTLLKALITSMRYFCPIQYDWAVEHWHLGKFPWEDDSDSIPIQLTEGEVQMSIENLRTLFEEVEKENRSTDYPVKFYENVKLNKSEVVEVGEEVYKLKVEFEKFPNEEVQENKISLPNIELFGMGLSCIGFGKEKVFISDESKFRGIEFWTLINHSRFLEDGNVLICGSGDGALQDFLLLTTQKKTAKEIYQFLKKNETEAVKTLFERVEKNIRDAEEDAKRDEIWQNARKDTDKKNLCRIYQKLHQRHLREVNRLISSGLIEDVLDDLITKEALDGQVKLSYLCNHFSGCYPFNRFLALLIAEHIKKRSGKVVFMEKTSAKEIKSIVGSDHICKEIDEECDEHSHLVKFAENCTCANMIGTIGKEEQFRRIIVRYGIKGTKAIFNCEPNFSGLQILPYTLP